MQTTIENDAVFALRAKVCQARNMSAEEKFFAGSELFEEACAWTLAGIADQFPHFTEIEREKELKRRLKLMDQLQP